LDGFSCQSFGPLTQIHLFGDRLFEGVALLDMEIPKVGTHWLVNCDKEDTKKVVKALRFMFKLGSFVTTQK
jgi:hypothetical protein